MTRDDVYDLVLGLSVAAVAYMLWKQQKAATQGNTGIVGPAIGNIPAPIEVQGDAEGGYFYDLADINSVLQGAV
jgi:hypothetical protein